MAVDERVEEGDWKRERAHCDLLEVRARRKAAAVLEGFIVDGKLV
jgi:hypothetical protein